VETVPALIDAIDLPSRLQLTDAALIVLAHHARLRVLELRALRWEDVYIRRGQVTLHVQARRGTKDPRMTVAATGGRACPAAALQRLYD
jgi:integrase